MPAKPSMGLHIRWMFMFVHPHPQLWLSSFALASLSSVSWEKILKVPQRGQLHKLHVKNRRVRHFEFIFSEHLLCCAAGSKNIHPFGASFQFLQGTLNFWSGPFRVWSLSVLLLACKLGFPNVWVYTNKTPNMEIPYHKIYEICLKQRSPIKPQNCSFLVVAHPLWNGLMESIRNGDISTSEDPVDTVWDAYVARSSSVFQGPINQLPMKKIGIQGDMSCIPWTEMLGKGFFRFDPDMERSEFLEITWNSQHSRLKNL